VTTISPVPQQISIPSADIVSGSSLSIPLYFVPVGEGQFKLGIVVTLTNPTDASQTTGPQMFEFDTGGSGFWADPRGTIPVPPAPAAADVLKIKYFSGNEYWAAPTSLDVQLQGTAVSGGEPQTATVSAEATVALVYQTANPFPIFNTFFGDFGCSLAAFTEAGAETPSLLTILAQLPAPYNSGFIVDLGAFPPAVVVEAEGVPQYQPGQLIVGLTTDLRALFPIEVPLVKQGTYTSPQTKAVIQTYGEQSVTGSLTVGCNTADGIGFVFDTGAPHTTIHGGKVLTETDYTPAKGDLLELTADTSGSDPVSTPILAYEVGPMPGQAVFTNRSVQATTTGYINTGLNQFFQSPVMFDLESGLIRFPAAASPVAASPAAAS
jgi:hypothetical protein